MTESTRKTKYSPEETRRKLLEAASNEIHRSGFRSASLDCILDEAGVTKGALYHHFGSKIKLGYAVIEELIAQEFDELWIHPLDNVEDPIDALVGILSALSEKEDEIACGCPLNNLANEMSPIDEGFRLRIQAIFHRWHGQVAAALRKGKAQGVVRADVSEVAVASLIVSCTEGMATLVKNSLDMTTFHQTLGLMIEYLQGLRAQPVPI